jgi:hypothetical protein
MKPSTDDLGGLDRIKIKVDKPINIDFDIEYQKLSLFTGLNGSGKSLIMKLSWAFSTIMAILHAEPHHLASDITQYVMDNTFEDQDFNGEIDATFRKGTLKMSIENGKIVRAEYYIDPAVKTCPSVTFMSKNTRTISQINQYLKLEKQLPTKDDLLEFYKLYDVAYVEQLKVRLEGGLKPTKEFKETLSKEFNIEHDFDTLAIENDVIVSIDKDGKRTNLSTFSDGDQSLITMTLASM